MTARVLALDLERALISDARRADPRLGLAAFLAFCCAWFERAVLFITVEEPNARAAVDQIAAQGHVSAELVGPSSSNRAKATDTGQPIFIASKRNNPRLPT